jgi:uncharacterized membrane protein YdjX (TVP38/TMEM64 family)
VADWLRAALPLVALAAFLVAAWRLGYFHLKDPRRLDVAAEQLQGTPWLGPIFVTVYAILAAFAAPVSPLAYVAGAVFGVVRGTLFVWIASMLGAAAGYFLARSAWSEFTQRLLGRFRDKVRGFRTSDAFLTTLRLQLLPITPFGILNYAAGASHMSFSGFIGGTAIGIIPGTIAAVYVGDRIVAGYRENDKAAFLLAGLAVVALLALSFAPGLVARLKRS